MESWLWDFALETISKFNMDRSHGIGHFVNTVLYLRMILEEFSHTNIIPGMSKSDEVELMIDAAFAHDLVDSKYMDEGDGIRRLEKVFIENGYTEEKFAIVVKIITTMSYSKRIARKRAGIPMIPIGPYTLATEIVVDADQLDGYDPERCRIYQETKFWSSAYDHLDESEKIRLSLGWRKTILVSRVLKYKSEFMNTNTGRKLAEPLHNNVIDHVKRELEDAEIFDY